MIQIDNVYTINTIREKGFYLDDIDVVLRRHHGEDFKPVKNFWSVQDQGGDEHRDKIGNQYSKIDNFLYPSNCCKLR